MAKGGARARSGPAPDPEALRRERDEGDWIDLPAEGRRGRAPAWPLTQATARERKLWTREWKRPQAVMWERNGQEVEVALYVRAVAAAELLGATAAARSLVLRYQEALGLSLPGLARNRWRIATSSQPQPRRSNGRAPAPASARKRFKVVTGGRA